MKGITLCADCAYYDLKKHKCNRGATVDPDISKGQDVRFYVDCPLDDVEPVQHWKIDGCIDRAAILRLLNEIEANATDIAYLSDNQQVFDSSHAILDRVELIRKELTGDVGNDDKI